jgi:hypothetical protein
LQGDCNGRFFVASARQDNAQQVILIATLVNWRHSVTVIGTRCVPIRRLEEGGLSCRDRVLRN